MDNPVLAFTKTVAATILVLFLGRAIVPTYVSIPRTIGSTTQANENQSFHSALGKRDGLDSNATTFAFVSNATATVDPESAQETTVVVIIDGDDDGDEVDDQDRSEHETDLDILLGPKEFPRLTVLLDQLRIWLKYQCTRTLFCLKQQTDHIPAAKASILGYIDDISHHFEEHPTIVIILVLGIIVICILLLLRSCVRRWKVKPANAATNDGDDQDPGHQNAKSKAKIRISREIRLIAAAAVLQRQNERLRTECDADREVLDQFGGSDGVPGIVESLEEQLDQERSLRHTTQEKLRTEKRKREGLDIQVKHHKDNTDRAEALLGEAQRDNGGLHEKLQRARDDLKLRQEKSRKADDLNRCEHSESCRTQRERIEELEAQVHSQGSEQASIGESERCRAHLARIHDLETELESLRQAAVSIRDLRTKSDTLVLRDPRFATGGKPATYDDRETQSSPRPARERPVVTNAASSPFKKPLPTEKDAATQYSPKLPDQHIRVRAAPSYTDAATSPWPWRRPIPLGLRDIDGATGHDSPGSPSWLRNEMWYLYIVLDCQDQVIEAVQHGRDKGIKRAEKVEADVEQLRTQVKKLDVTAETETELRRYAQKRLRKLQRSTAGETNIDITDTGTDSDDSPDSPVNRDQYGACVNCEKDNIKCETDETWNLPCLPCRERTIFCVDKFSCVQCAQNRESCASGDCDHCGSDLLPPCSKLEGVNIWDWCTECTKEESDKRWRDIKTRWKFEDKYGYRPDENGLIDTKDKADDDKGEEERNEDDADSDREMIVDSNDARLSPTDQPYLLEKFKDFQPLTPEQVRQRKRERICICCGENEHDGIPCYFREKLVNARLCTICRRKQHDKEFGCPYHTSYRGPPISAPEATPPRLDAGATPFDPDKLPPPVPVEDVENESDPDSDDGHDAYQPKPRLNYHSLREEGYDYSQSRNAIVRGEQVYDYTLRRPLCSKCGVYEHELGSCQNKSSPLPEPEQLFLWRLLRADGRASGDSNAPEVVVGSENQPKPIPSKPTGDNHEPDKAKIDSAHLKDKAKSPQLPVPDPITGPPSNGPPALESPPSNPSQPDLPLTNPPPIDSPATELPLAGPSVNPNNGLDPSAPDFPGDSPPQPLRPTIDELINPKWAKKDPFYDLLRDPNYDYSQSPSAVARGDEKYVYKVQAPICFRCGEYGHLVRHCADPPLKPKERKFLHDIEYVCRQRAFIKAESRRARGESLGSGLSVVSEEQYEQPSKEDQGQREEAPQGLGSHEEDGKDSTHEEAQPSTEPARSPQDPKPPQGPAPISAPSPPPTAAPPSAPVAPPTSVPPPTPAPTSVPTLLPNPAPPSAPVPPHTPAPAPTQPPPTATAPPHAPAPPRPPRGRPPRRRPAQTESTRPPKNGPRAGYQLPDFMKGYAPDANQVDQTHGASKFEADTSRKWDRSPRRKPKK